MDLWLIIVLVIAAIVIIGIIYRVTAGKNRRIEQRRETAAEQRQEAQVAAQSAGEAEIAARRQQELAEAEKERALILEREAVKSDPDR
ncbi:MAG: hypothetical protein ACRDKT_04675 [Actinomycetota bacterium]